MGSPTGHSIDSFPMTLTGLIDTNFLQHYYLFKQKKDFDWMKYLTHLQ